MPRDGEEDGSLSERVIRRPVDGSHDSAVLALVESIEATDVDDVGPAIQSVRDPAQESSNGALAGAVPDLDREQRDVPVDRCEPAPVAPDDGRRGRAVSMEVADRQATWVAVGDDRVVLRYKRRRLVQVDEPLEVGECVVDAGVE